ncbi:MAG: PAS domain S-box protein, partial [Proteobacteria bacterium]|nr:PAS domain S-box protein [Pseudomonadota bacterium]
MNFPPSKAPPTLSAISSRSPRTGEADIFEIFEALVANSQDIFFSLSSQGALEYVSPQWSIQLGYPPEEVIGRFFTDFVENPEECRQAFRRATKTADATSDNEVRFRTKDGRVLRYLAHARPDRGADDEIRRVVGVAKNVTVLLEVQEQLQESEHRLRSLLESLADPAVIYDLEGGCQYLNPAFRQVFGWTLEEFQDRRIAFVPEEEVGPTMAKIEGIIERGEAVSQFATKRLSKDGRLLDIVISASRFYGSQDRPAGLSAILRDVTEQRRLERELADRLVELMEVKSQLESQADELTRLNAEMMLANQRLTELSLTDHLTGLHNHRSFQERADQEIKRVRRYKT